MTKNANFNIKINEVSFRENKVFFTLNDGREVGVPLNWYPKLENATEIQRANYSISPGGYGVHWEDLDEDLSAYGILTTRLEPNTNVT